MYVNLFSKINNNAVIFNRTVLIIWTKKYFEIHYSSKTCTELTGPEKAVHSIYEINSQIYFDFDPEASHVYLITFAPYMKPLVIL